MIDLKSFAQQVWQSATDSVQPTQLIPRKLHIHNNRLQIADHSYSLEDLSGVLVVGFGKAAAEMARVTEIQLRPITSCGKRLYGLVNAPADETDRMPTLEHIEVNLARPAGLNVPTEAAAEGTERIMEMVANAEPDELILVLISGGGSALSPAPIEGISLNDKLAVTRYLNESVGAPIEEINCVRRILSKIKGGGLLRTARGKVVHSFILSDVIGDALEVIASGPLVDVQSDASRALSILERYDPERQSIPYSVYTTIEAKIPSIQRSEVNHTECHNTIIGSNRTAVESAISTARDLGFEVEHHIPVTNQVEKIGNEIANWLCQAELKGDKPKALIGGGEPVISLPSNPGRGGRNQQLVLATLLGIISANPLDCDFCFLSAGTDGEDGPTDAAGAFLDNEIVRKILQESINPNKFFDRADAYTFFSRVGGLFKTGLTGTNVCDVWVILKL